MAIATPSMQQLLEAGVHFGHQVRRGHPKMGEYIFGARDGVHIINLEFSEKLLKQAAEYACLLGKEGKTLLFVGTKKQAQPIIREFATKVNAPFVDFRWIGGLLTNFDEVRKNIRKLLDLRKKQEKGELDRYTKKEQLLISRKLSKFAQEYGGVEELERLPDAMFLTDCVNDKTALAEAVRLRVPVISIADSNSNPMMVDYPIPGNDDAAKSIKILVETIADAYGQGLKEAGEKKAKEEAKKEEKAEDVAAVSKAVEGDVAAAEEKVEQQIVKEQEREV